MWWGYAPTKNGNTSGKTCGYCRRIYLGRVKSRGITVEEYKAELGHDKSKLDSHRALIAATISIYTQRACSRRAHIDWDSEALKSLRQVKAKETVVSKPGYSHVEYGYYMSDPAHKNHVQLELGHREYTLNGVR
eukprot:8526943-Prorocentrum_lima.AAC.1